MIKVRLLIISIFLKISYYKYLYSYLRINRLFEIQTLRNILEIHTAGLPSANFDVQMTMLPRPGICPNTESLGDQTSVHALISPNIFTKYGLTHIDFFKVNLFIQFNQVNLSVLLYIHIYFFIIFKCNLHLTIL